MNIRQAVIHDSQQLVQLFTKLDNETNFMLFESGERKITVEMQVKQMQSFTDSTSQVMFVAENQYGEIVGFIVGIGGNFMRNKHSLYCVIGVLLSEQGQGIGKKLLGQLECWAQIYSFHRLELTVMEHNQSAINLYQSCGFYTEGVKRDSLKVAGEFVNELYMSKLLTA